MISAAQVCRAREARSKGRKAYSFARAGSLWVPKCHKIDAAGFNCAFTPAFASFDSGAQTPFDWPGASSLVSWHDWALDRSYNTTLASTGSTPPAITLTGTVPIGLGLEVRITTGFSGARGTAKFETSFDNGATWSAPVLTAATYALPGAGTGVTLNFTNLPYTDDNHYYLKQNTWYDQTANSYDWLEDSAPNNPVPQVTALGTALQFTSANGILREATGLAPTLAGGANNSWTMFAVCKINNLSPTSGLGMILFLGSTSLSHWHYVGFNTTPDWICGKNGNTSTVGGTPDTSVHVVEMAHDGTNTTVLLDGTIVAGPTAQGTGSLTLNVASICSSFIGGAVGNTCAISYYAMLTYSSGLDATTRGEIRQNLKRPYGIL